MCVCMCVCVCVCMYFTKVYIYIYIYISCPTVVEGDPKVLFSIVTTARWKWGSYFFLWIGPLICNLHYNADCLPRSHQVPFLSLWYDSTNDWTPISRTIGERSAHFTNGPLYIQIYTYKYTLLLSSYISIPRTHKNFQMQHVTSQYFFIERY